MNFEKICRDCPDEPWCIKSRGTGCGSAKWETAVLLGSEASEEMNPMDLAQGEVVVVLNESKGCKITALALAYSGEGLWYKRGSNSKRASVTTIWNRPKKKRQPKMGDLIVVSNVPFEETDDSGIFVLFHSFNDKGRALQLCTHGEEGIEYDYWRFPNKSDFKEA